jgi:cell surface protein SprA
MTRGQFNYSVDLASTLTPTRNWGGIMKPLSISAINLTKENVNFIELWMRLDRVPQDSTARLILDLGVISEDAIPNRQLNSEDLVLGSTPNGTVQEGEDVGLDMLTDDQERARYRTLTDRYPDLAGDPSGDDYAYDNQQQDYGRINGTQGNMNGPGGRVPDTEDLNSNGVVDLANSYYQYEIPLSTDSPQNPYIVSSSSAGWYQFRIPIDGFARKVGLPTQENIESMRLFFAGVSDTIHIRIADISLVGNQWQKLDKTDSSYAVAVVNVEDNPGVYMSPAGVVRERDKTQPDKEVYANEQSMAIVLNGLPDGQSRQVVKFFSYKAYDVFNYRTMKMFVHGDPKFQYTDDSDYDAEFFFRFGLDSLNYYEYRSPLRPGWQEGTNDVVINFGDLTAIKQTRDSTTVPSAAIPVPGKPGAFYRVLGNPSLTQIVYLAIGVENPRGKGTSAPLEGQVWVNELRVLSVDDTPGWAYRVDAQFKMADFGTVGVNYSRVDPFFHQLEQKFGSRSLSKNWGLNVSLALDRLLPESWVGTSIPISFSHVEGSTDPRYLPNSDVLVGEATELLRQKIISSGGSPELARSRADSLKLAAQTQRVSNTYAAPNFRIVVPSDWWLIRDTFNKLSYGLNYSESRERSPAVSQHASWSWNFRLGYSIAFPADYYVAPFRDLFRGLPFLDSYKDFKLYFAPSQFNWSVGFSRSRDQSLQRITGAREILFRNFSGNRNLGYNWKLTEGGLLNLTNDYTINAESSLLALETDASGNQRPFSSILWDMFVGSGRLINWGQDIRSSQRNQFTFKPSIPDIFGIKRYYDMSFSYSSDYSWSNSLVRGDIGKSAAFSSSTTFSVNVRPKPLFDQLFQTQPATPQQPAAPQTGRGRRTEQPGAVTDTTQRADTSAAQQKKGFDPLDALRTAAVVLVKIPFLDYDNINLTFTQNNSSQNSGVVGRTGFLNYWGRLPFAEPLLEYGPSRMYQLGLVSDPSGRLTNFHFKGSPPFFGWDVQTGLRAKGGVLVNSYRQTNRFTMKTSRSLWEGARLDMSWSLGWNYNRTQNIVTDTLIGIPTIQNTIASGGIDRSFMSIPSSLTFGLVKTGINQVSKIYGQLRADQGDQRLDEEKLAQAFEEGFESLPLFRALFGKYYPRLNWGFRWDGLEKLKLFQGFVSRLSLDHAYNSTFNLQNQDRPGVGTRLTTGERVEAGFSPLVGLNFTFKELAKGNLGATLRYSTSTGYDLATSARNIVERITQELSFTASYTRRGFEIPFFGLSLNNDIDITMNYSVSKNSRKTYDVSRLDVSVKAIPLDGTTRTVMEPRLRYVLSQRVTATIYYRYTSTKPDASGSRIPGSTINEAGLDVRITIQ